MGHAMPFTIQRIYDDAPVAYAGRRILVDRLWPRGVSREKARLDAWLRDVAPSNDLRKWFNHEVAKWPEFKKRYLQELRAPECEAVIKGNGASHEW